MYHQLFTRARILYQEERKYFSRSKNKLIIIFNALFYSDNFISDERLLKND